MRQILLVGLTLLATGAAVAGEPGQRTLTFEDRVAAQKAIEQVYWTHRIWPTPPPMPRAERSSGS
jgi:hypothetical protein